VADCVDDALGEETCERDCVLEPVTVCDAVWLTLDETESDGEDVWLAVRICDGVPVLDGDWLLD
jgi:hypothetical protein